MIARQGNPIVLERCGKPNKMDQFPKGTKCMAFITSSNIEYYEQISSDEENPIWELIDE